MYEEGESVVGGGKDGTTPRLDSASATAAAEPAAEEISEAGEDGDENRGDAWRTEKSVFARGVDEETRKTHRR